MLLGDLLDLVLPATCAGCDEPATGAVCRPCAAALQAVTPRRTQPVPPPAGLPATYALAAYGGSLQRMLIQYKERNRHELTPVLGGLLARVVRAGPVLLVPVPATAAAARRRYGDHIDRLAHEAAKVLRRAGHRAEVGRLLRALPKADSTELSAAARAEAARHAFVVRRHGTDLSGARVVLVDDILTTGATLAAAAGRLRAAGIRVDRAAVLAATQKTS